jgi:hypothetical protein
MFKKEKAPKEDQILSEDRPDVRAPYSSPELRVYGDVEKLTLAAGPAGHLDGNTIAGHRRTH